MFKDSAVGKYMNIPEVALAYMSPEQTGRINKNVDIGTDFYSYGVILYEMITGSLPFENKNITELIYCHIAKKPIEPVEFSKEIDKNISDIIMKLLAKNPEDRFKTGSEIRNELIKCRYENKIKNVKINQSSIIRNIHKNSEELKKLKGIYKRISNNNMEIAAVIGDSGTGKTSVINEFLCNIEKEHPVIICNCDNNKDGIPFYCFTQGIKKYIYNENYKLQINDKLLDDIKSDAEFILELIPYINAQKCNDNYNVNSLKINKVIQKLFKKISDNVPSCIMFIDNFQWIDNASLSLLVNLIKMLSKNKVFFIISMQKEDNAIKIAEDNLKTLGVYINSLVIDGLNKKDIEYLIVQNFECNDKSNEIAEIIFNKTKGNITAINQIFDKMFKDEMLVYDFKSENWIWDVHLINEITNLYNITAIIKSKYNGLSKKCIYILNISSCLGQEFNIIELKMLTGEKKDELIKVLYEAAACGIITYIGKGVYSFYDNMIHSIIYSCINSNEKKLVHYKIASKMVKCLDINKINNSIFTIINHYNIGMCNIKNENEKLLYSKLNYKAGDISENSGTFEMAEGFYESCLRNIPKGLNKKYPNIIFSLNTKIIKCKLRNGKNSEALRLTHNLSKVSNSLHKRYITNCFYMFCYFKFNNHKRVMSIGFNTLDILDNKINLNVKDIKNKTYALLDNIKDGKFEQYEKSPVIVFLKKEYSIDVISSLIFNMHIRNMKTFNILVLNALSLCIENSGSEFLSYIYMNFSIMLLKNNDYKNSFEIGKRALALNSNVKKYNPTVLFLYAAFISSISEPLSSSCIYLEKSIDKSNTYIYNKYNFLSVNTLFLFMILQGKNINIISTEIKKYINQFDFNDNNCFNTIISLTKFLDYLKKYDVENDCYIEQKKESLDDECNDIIYKICLSFKFYNDGQNEKTFTEYSLNNNQLNLMKETIFEFIYLFEQSIAIASLYDDSSQNIKIKYINKIKKNIKVFKHFAEINPVNFNCRYYLILGEYYRIKNDKNKAIEYYDMAVKSAKENKYINIEALANEIAARFYIKNRFDASARIYMLEAIHCYRVWGADGKAERLENTYCDILWHKYEDENIENPREYNYSKKDSYNIDFKSAINASFTISSEIDNERLVEKLLENVTLNTGAEKAFLIKNTNEKLMVEAYSVKESDGINIYKNLDNSIGLIPESIISEAISTMQDVVYNNVADIKRFSEDPYIIRHKPKSILCMPILLNGNVAAIVYLENNIITHAFTKDRLQVLKIICTQAAISIKNAEMFSEIKELNKKLEEKVYERTNELEVTVIKLKKQIKERKLIQCKLPESERRYRKVVEACPDTILVDDGKNILLINKAGAKLFGYKKPEEIIGKSIYELYPKQLVNDLRKNCFKNKNNEDVYFFEHEITRKNKEIVSAETTIIPFERDSDYKLLAITRDITSRKNENVLKDKVEEKNKELNAAKEYDKLRTEFFANVSHELRTPLNVILGAQTVLKMLVENIAMEGQTQGKVNSYMSIIKQNCYRLVRLINNLIDITKMDAGYFQVEFSNNDIVNTIENITLSVAEYVKSKGIELCFDTDVEEKIMAFDPDKIERIILNLLSNSIKFTDSNGKITVNINDEGEMVKITVQDTGIGIPEEKQKLIFERFVQVDKSLSRNHEGSGIGLSLVKSLVEMHNGTISLESKIGCGSKFTIKLPSHNVICSNKYIDKNFGNSNVERINIEFSDIYS